MAAPVLVCDFDGTLSLADVGDALCARFADPSWAGIDEAWLRGEVSLPEAQRRMWRLVRADRESLLGEALRVGALRAGADALFERARDGSLDLVLASGGFGLYVEALLGERLALLAARFHNDLAPGPEGAVPTFPHADLACALCAVCKARVVRRYLAQGRRVAFCGDGSSDRCVAGVAPTVFAVRGSLLARHCNERDVPHVPFEDFREILSHPALTP